MLTSVTDHTGRAWTFQYENDPADNPSSTATPYVTLRSITDPLSGICTFTYQGDNRITAKQYPRGNTPYSQTYSATLTEPAVRSSPHQRNEDGVCRTDGLAVNLAVSGDEA